MATGKLKPLPKQIPTLTSPFCQRYHVVTRLQKIVTDPKTVATIIDTVGPRPPTKKYPQIET